MLHMFAYIMHCCIDHTMCSVLNLCTAKCEVAVMANTGFWSCICDYMLTVHEC